MYAQLSLCGHSANSVTDASVSLVTYLQHRKVAVQGHLLRQLRAKDLHAVSKHFALHDESDTVVK